MVKLTFMLKIPIMVYIQIKTVMKHGTQKMHGLGNVITELIKYSSTLICSRNRQHALKR